MTATEKPEKRVTVTGKRIAVGGGFVFLMMLAALVVGVPWLYAAITTDEESAAVPDNAQSLPVSGTACRPSFLSLFTLSKNNLNPTLTITDTGLQVRVVKTTDIAWSEMERVDVRDGLKSTYVVLTCGKWEYVIHFRDTGALRTLVERLQDQEVSLTDAAVQFLTDNDAS